MSTANATSAGSIPQAFKARSIPTLNDNLNLYLKATLTDLTTTLNGILAMLPQAASAPPSQTQLGMVRYAQAPWWPVTGQNEDAWVRFGVNGWEYE